MTTVSHKAFRASTIGIAAALVAATAAAATDTPSRGPALGIRLTSADSGAGTAFVLGASGVPRPSDFYAQTANGLFLQPNGFTGTPTVLETPESSSDFGPSEHEGANILVNAIQARIAEGGISADNPIYVFGYSQSSALSTYAMEQLNAAGVPLSDVHFVLVGNTANPNGGLLTAFDVDGTHPFIPALNVTLDQATPNDLYPTDVYTLEYDGWADFPRYPMNFISVLNDIAGMAMTHPLYLGLTPEQIADAVQLPVTPDSTADYYMIHSDILPLLAPLRLMPGMGKPLYDLLEPDMRILVNLGYGNIDHGWNDGPADTPTPVSFGMPNLDWSQVLTALNVGWQQGLTAYSADLPGVFIPEPLMANPVIAAVVGSLYGDGVITDANPANWTDLINSIVVSPPGAPVETFGEFFGDWLG
ncbi:PE-PPE domain-containing protein [Mycobacterium sp. M1]|uniref:PE-PPE domain-containing protein n=1 Tax=Mycolicibacter acidiphilus TaxID=2835306 RepID=A0ABS5RIL7_9MYCO|nr:PE-PPE domain-containing protein [Mycolicibacter acidiphilus]MBS9534110.1 PE-PPE domain-containing protein [Mycolicibacter acidiphilus]